MLSAKSTFAILATLVASAAAGPVPAIATNTTCPLNPEPNINGSPVTQFIFIGEDLVYNPYGSCSYLASWNGRNVSVMTSGLRPPYYPGTYPRARTLTDQAFSGLKKYGDVIAETLDSSSRHWLLRNAHDGFVPLQETAAFKAQIGQPSCSEFIYQAYAAVGQAAYNLATKDDLINNAADLSTVLFNGANPTDNQKLPVFTQWARSTSVEAAIAAAGGSTGSAKPADWARSVTVAQLNAANPAVSICNVSA